MFDKETELNTKNQIKYFTDDKKKLKEKILKLSKHKNRQHIVNISKIILINTDNYTNNSNGIFAFFHDLPEETYQNIDNYLIEIEKNKNKMFIKNLTSDFSDTIVDSDNLIKNNKLSESYNIEIDTEKYLTNKEKVIMRRKNYEKYLEKNQQ
jgi:hypothetical protein